MYSLLRIKLGAMGRHVETFRLGRLHMADNGPQTASRLPIEQFSRMLLECAKSQPQVISRMRSVVAGAPDTPTGASRNALSEFPSMSLLADPTVDIRQYLEDLAAIAISAARHAEDAQRQACDTSRKARYAMAAVVTFGILGLGVGSAGFLASRSASGRAAEVSSNLRTVEDLQRQTGDQLAAIRSGIDEQRALATAAAIAVPPPSPPVNRLVAAPSHPSLATNSVPWPDSQPYARRVALAQRRQSVVVPSFFTAIQRNVSNLFH
jgi:hypothetical protein